MKIKFLSFNILWGGLFSGVSNFISSENPDILTLQEAKENEVLVDIKNRTGLSHSHFLPLYTHREVNGETLIGNMTLSKYEIREGNQSYFNRDSLVNEIYTKEEVDADPQRVPRGIQHTQIALEEKIINVFNVHGIWGWDGLDSELRTKMSDIIVRDISGKENVILAGDFNMFPATQAIDNIEKHLKNVFKDELKTTFNIKRKPDSGNWANSVVDMMFVSPNINILEHYSPQVDVSDHLPLVAVLEI